MTVDLSRFREVFHRARHLIYDPHGFFKSMTPGSDIVYSLFFLLVFAGVTGVVAGLAQALTRLIGLEVYAGFAMGLLSFVLLPIVSLLIALGAGFIFAALCHVLWKFMGSPVSYKTSYQCVAYLAALGPLVALFSVIPLIGGALGIVLVLRYLCIVSEVVHGIALQRAWIVFGVIGIFFVFLSLSSRYAAWKLTQNMEQAAQSWQGATEQMEHSADELRRLMDRELEHQKEAIPDH